MKHLYTTIIWIVILIISICVVFLLNGSSMSLIVTLPLSGIGFHFSEKIIKK